MPLAYTVVTDGVKTVKVAKIAVSTTLNHPCTIRTDDTLLMLSAWTHENDVCKHHSCPICLAHRRPKSYSMPPSPVPDEVAFESLKASLDSVPTGVKMMLNSGEFYGPNLPMLARFFKANPGYADKAFLSVKGGASFTPQGIVFDASSVTFIRYLLYLC